MNKHPNRNGLAAATRYSLSNTLLCALAAACSLLAPPVLANQQLASDNGCYNCHGQLPPKNTPTMAALAEHMAKYRGDEAALKKRSEKLRAGSALHSIAAHEKLSPEMALTLIRWLSEDGPH